MKFFHQFDKILWKFSQMEIFANWHIRNVVRLEKIYTTKRSDYLCKFEILCIFVLMCSNSLCSGVKMILHPTGKASSGTTSRWYFKLVTPSYSKLLYSRSAHKVFYKTLKSARFASFKYVNIFAREFQITAIIFFVGSFWLLNYENFRV